MTGKLEKPVDSFVSFRMRRVRQIDTGPELVVRKLVHSAGYRYRLHRKDLPGKPDIVFPSRRKIVFVHGCFWHGHEHCKRARLPKTRLEYWSKKIQRNKERDEQVVLQLEQLGWIVQVIWECETKNLQSLRSRLINFLD